MTLRPIVVAMALWATFGLSACTSSGSSVAPGEPMAAGEVEDIAPRPFTAEQIAAAMPLGYWHRYSFETPGQATFEQLSTVVSHDEEGVTLKTEVFELDGSPRGEPGSLTAAWVELRNHATWPRADTVIEHTSLTLSSGSYDCWKYTVTSLADGVPVVESYYFAKNRPGAPVRYDSVRDGVRVFRMSLLSSAASR